MAPVAKAQREMKIFGLAGWSGSGKTTLMTKIIPALRARGVTLSTMKHAHHFFELDTPGKDSYEHRQAGATEVLITSARRWALMHELREHREPTMEELVARMTPVDLLLVEGYKSENHEKLEIHDSTLGKALLYPDDPKIVGLAADRPLADVTLPQLLRDDIPAIVDFIMDRCQLTGTQEGVV